MVAMATFSLLGYTWPGERLQYHLSSGSSV